MTIPHRDVLRQTLPGVFCLIISTLMSFLVARVVLRDLPGPLAASVQLMLGCVFGLPIHLLPAFGQKAASARYRNGESTYRGYACAVIAGILAAIHMGFYLLAVSELHPSVTFSCTALPLILSGVYDAYHDRVRRDLAAASTFLALAGCLVLAKVQLTPLTHSKAVIGFLCVGLSISKLLVEGAEAAAKDTIAPSKFTAIRFCFLSIAGVCLAGFAMRNAKGLLMTWLYEERSLALVIAIVITMMTFSYLGSVARRRAKEHLPFSIAASAFTVPSAVVPLLLAITGITSGQGNFLTLLGGLSVTVGACALPFGHRRISEIKEIQS